MSVLGNLIIRISADNKELASALTDTEKRLRKQTKAFTDMADKMASTGKKMTTFVTLPLLGIGTAATKMAMDAVESENLFEVSMGKMAKEARDWSQELSKALGLNQYEIRQQVGTFNVMLDSMGLAEDQAYDMAKSLVQLTYDMSSFYNLKPEEAFQKLQSGISGEIEPLKRLGIVINETTVQTYAYTHGIANQGEQLTEQQKILARYGVIMEQTSKAQGDMARTIESPANQLRILQSELKETAISFGMILIPMVQKAMDAVKPYIEGLRDLSDEKKNLIVNIGLVVAALGPAMMIIGQTTKTVINLRNTILTLNTAIASFAASGSIMAKTLSGIVTGLAQFGLQGIPAIGSFIEDIGLLKTATGELQHIINEMTGLKVANWWKAWENEIPEVATRIQNQAITLSKASSEIQSKAVELFETYKKGNLTLDELNDKLGDLIEVQNDASGSAEKAKLMLEEETKALEEQGYTHEKAIELAKQDIQTKGYQVEAIDEETAALDKQKQTVDELIASLYKLYNFNQSVTEATWNYEDSLVNLTEVMKNANSTEREKQEAIFATQDALEQLQISMLREYQDTETSIERKKELQNQYIKTGLEAVNSGAISEAAFVKMAAQFGLSKDEIVKAALDMDNKLDWVTRERFIHISHNMSGVESDVDKLYDKLKQIDGMQVTFKMVQTGLMSAYKEGGIVGYSQGALIDKITSAQKGINLPKFDDGGVLAMLHPPEVVLNPKQALNLVWNMANTRKESGKSTTIIQNIYPQTSVDLTDTSNIRIIKQAVAEALNR